MVACNLFVFGAKRWNGFFFLLARESNPPPVRRIFWFAPAGVLLGRLVVVLAWEFAGRLAELASCVVVAAAVYPASALSFLFFLLYPRMFAGFCLDHAPSKCNPGGGRRDDCI